MEPKLYKKKVITKEYYELYDNDNNHNSLVKVSEAPAARYMNNWPVPGISQVSSAEFTSSIMNYFDQYSVKMKKMINETTGTEDALSKAEEGMFADIWEIATLLRPYYSAEFCEKFLQVLRAIALSELQAISLVRSGFDTRNLTDFRMNTLIINDLAITLNAFNNSWNQQQIREIWTRITNSWFQAIKAKHAKDNTAGDRHLQDADIFLKQFASMVAQGVVNQYPERFFTTNPTA